MSSHDASANAAGYSYQFERALQRIFHNEHADTRFGIETADDLEQITPHAQGHMRTLEQDKLTTREQHPLQDSSRNLWNTLHHWLAGLSEAREQYPVLEFVLVTNRSVNNGSLVHQLAHARSPDQVAAALDALRLQGAKMSGATATLAAAVLAHSDEALCYLIAHLHMADGVDAPHLRASIEAALQFPDGLTPAHRDATYHGLLGMLVSQCLSAWKQRRPFWTTARPYNTQKHLLFERFLNESWKALPQEQTHCGILREQYRDLDVPFLGQLRALDLPERLIEQALGHYWAAHSERTRLLASGRVLPEDLNDTEALLYDRWETLRDAHSLRCGSDPNGFDLADYKTLYQQTADRADFQLSLGRVKSQHRYLYMGTCHHLANHANRAYPLHWHRDTRPQP